MLRALIKTMRPKQWTKNAFVFAALVFDRQLLNPSAVLITFVGFILFCLISSAIYIINDVADVQADRQHPTKRNRPIASGALPIRTAITAAALMLAVIFPIAYLLSIQFFLIALLYLLINLSYSLWFKHIPLVDVMILAAGYVLRVVAGVSLITVERFSPWLYVVTTLFALYIGFGKRRAEMTLLAKGNGSTRRVLEGYTIPFLDQLIIVTSSTTIVAYSLYTFSAPNLPDNHIMMLTIPFVLYGIFRYLYLLQVKGEGGAPDELLLFDRPLQAAILLWGLSILVIFYLIPRG